MTVQVPFPEIEKDNSLEGEIVTRVDATYWGYVLRTNSRPAASTVIAQWISGAIGCAAVAAAAGFWILPGAFLSGDVIIFKAVASLLVLSVGIFLLWYASAGAKPELQVDQTRKEVREMMRNSKGQTRLVATHKFEDIVDITVQRDADDDILGKMLIRIDGSKEAILAAHAPEHQLSVLRRKLVSDIIKAPRESAEKLQAPELPVSTPGNSTETEDFVSLGR